MRRTALLILAGCAFLPLASCGPGWIQGLADVNALNSVCVTNFKATFVPRSGNAFTDGESFQAVLTNPLAYGVHGSIEIVMGITAKNVHLGSPTTNFSGSTTPGFATAVTTVYPPGTEVLSPVAFTLPHDQFTTYDIEIYTNIPGLGYDGTPCHTFKASNVKI